MSGELFPFLVEADLFFVRKFSTGPYRKGWLVSSQEDFLIDVNLDAHGDPPPFFIRGMKNRRR